MHLEKGLPPADYIRYTRRRSFAVTACFAILLLLIPVSLSLGAVKIPFSDVLEALFTRNGTLQTRMIILNIRLPQVIAAATAGAGLSIAGAVMQSVLRNPLGSPYTLGISSAAAFGAAFAVMVLSSGAMQSTAADPITVTSPYLTTLWAFLACSLAAGIILAVSRSRASSPETMILTGVALGSLFTAGTMVLQYFADDTQLAAMVFWTFGDLARASWREVLFISSSTVLALVYFILNRWNYNGIDSGDETAAGLGIHVKAVRLTGMVVGSLVTAVIISFVGVIGFVGLVCPHIARRMVGGDHRFLLPASIALGGILLLVSDTAARLVLAPRVLPVSIITAFTGAPVFILLLIRGHRKWN